MFQDVVHVPIGCNCDVAMYLRRRGLRREAFPFDWVVSMLPEVTRCIREDFAGFHEGSFVVRHAVQTDLENGGKHAMKHVSFPRYRLLSLHDFHVQVDNEAEVKEKYDRRIERFRELMSSGSEVVFCVDRSTARNARHVGYCEGYDRGFLTPRGREYEKQITEFEACIRSRYPRLRFRVTRV